MSEAVPTERTVVGDHPLLPDYSGPCISNVVPALIEPGAEIPAWMPEVAADAAQVVLLVLDGLGWDQLGDRPELAPTLSAMSGGPISSVVPSTTATALTSIATGLTPGEHGVVGYRVSVKGEVLNVLRWNTLDGDARKRIDPKWFQPHAAFGGQRPAIVTKSDFAESGFSGAHLSDVRFNGYRMTSTLVTELAHQLAAGEPFIYAYYDGIDKVAHEYGFGDYYDAELAAADRLVAEVRGVLGPGSVVVVTADHGQVHTGDQVQELAGDLTPHLSHQSGEARFRWLHARPGHVDALAEAAQANHGDRAWVRTAEDTVDEGWWGPEVTAASRKRLGDVALVAMDEGAFSDPADTGPFVLVGRHGSLTSAEMRVPLLAGAG